MRFRDVFVESLVYELPPVSVSTAEIEGELAPLYRRMGITPGWLETVTGIRERRLWHPGVQPSQVATRVGARALVESGVDPSSVGILINASVSRDFVEPSTACLVHGALGLSSHCLNFDIGNACLGFINAMITVSTLLEAGRIEAGLIVAAESSREVLEATLDRLTRPGADVNAFKDELATLTLGSAAVAMVMTRGAHTRTGRAFLGGDIQAATEFNDLCRGTNTRMVTDASRLLGAGVDLARKTWPRFVETLGWTPPMIREFALHQVGAAHHRSLLASLKLPVERALEIYSGLGNIGSAGVPLTTARAAELGRVRSGDKVAMMGIGSGLNCAMMGIQW
jgi:3-oxoacyl-[acyl-carrier-protein] synthase III